MRILLTGATGFLGSYLLRLFVKSGYEVIALKRTTSNTYRIDSYLKKVTLYDIDKVNLEDIFKNHKIDIVINTVTKYLRYKFNIWIKVIRRFCKC